MKTYLVRNVKLGLDHGPNEIKTSLAKKLRLPQDAFTSRLYRESIDARKGSIQKNYQVLVDTDLRPSVSKKEQNDVVEWEEATFHPRPGTDPLEKPPIIVGSGPCGLFAAILLADYGYRPIVLERGQKVTTRQADVDRFWATGKLDPQSNVQFGEGGAGTFSDGKLTSRSKDPRLHHILSTFVRFGAPEEILWLQYPHIGTDILREVVSNMQDHIIKKGGQFLFGHQVKTIEWEDLAVGSRQITKVITDKTTFNTSQVILSIGHSARDTFQDLRNLGIAMENKPFAMGFRIEHPQQMVENAQYGPYAYDQRLPRASYRLTHQSKEIGADGKNRGVYTFCMCPGGYVVNASSEEDRLCVNGMSYHDRGGTNANSAVLTTLPVEGLAEDLFSGMNYQTEIEREAFRLGGGNYNAPVQRVKDFLEGRPSTKLGAIEPTIKPGYRLTDLSKLYPSSVTTALRESLLTWGRKISGFSQDDAILTGVEARSSSPIRILRDDNFESLTMKGLYPAGEGAGYAGGIVSSALDGLKIANELIEKHQPLQ